MITSFSQAQTDQKMRVQTLLCGIVFLYFCACSTEQAFLEKAEENVFSQSSHLPSLPPFFLSDPPKEQQESLQFSYGLKATSPEQLSLEVLLQGGNLVPHPRLPMDLLFLVDISGTMATEQKLAEVKKSLLKLLDFLHFQDRIAIVLFDEVPEIWLLFTPIQERENIREQIHSIHPRGGSNLPLALEKCYRIFETQPLEYQRHLILLTDGPDSPNSLTSLETRISQSFEKKRIMLSIVGLGLENDQEFLIKMVQAGRGQYRFVPYSEDILPTLEALLQKFANTLVSTLSMELFFEDPLGEKAIPLTDSFYPYALEYPEFRYLLPNLSVQEPLRFRFMLPHPKKDSSPQALCRITLRYQDALQKKKIEQNYLIFWPPSSYSNPPWLEYSERNYQMIDLFRQVVFFLQAQNETLAIQRLTQVLEIATHEEQKIIRNYLAFLQNLPTLTESKWLAYFIKQLQYQAYLKQCL